MGDLDVERLDQQTIVTTLREILHVVSVGVACLEQHGIIERKAPDGK